MCKVMDRRKMKRMKIKRIRDRSLKHNTGRQAAVLKYRWDITDEKR